MTALYLGLGVVFGLALSRSGAADFGTVQGMFLLQDFQLYGIIGVAVALTMPGLWVLQRRGHVLASKPSHAGNLVGGALFGVGWAMTGMCPGPIFVNLGEGKLYAIPVLAGALFGTWLYGRTRQQLERPLGLPSVSGPEAAPAARS
ncbi:MAG: YeeE/YedE family protein [Deltaproteobacteria bacterium]|nr:YeeE/YedE family protein [Deltaproteobacteria bacterium]